MKINSEGINQEYVVLNRKRMTKKKYRKMLRGLLLICPHESEAQTGVVLTTSQGKKESAQKFDLKALVCLSATWK